MRQAFDPSKAAGQNAIVQYDLDTPQRLVSYQLNVDSGTCTVEKGTSGEPRATMAMSLSDFTRLMAGALDGMTAFTSGRLKISGDLMFPQTMVSWFKQPGS
jgi:putative sterol carrier protein